MQHFEAAPQSPEEQLAIDEALLLSCGKHGGEWIRLWEFREPVVVLGRSSKVSEEVDLATCRQLGVPVLRRSSGGASVVGGPGCLMYSVILDLRRRPELNKIDAAHVFMMKRLKAAVETQLNGVQFQGTCDLTWRNRKFSGNSLRLGRHSLLYHGTILYDADLEMMARCLADAPRQPEYRQGRSHDQFVVNVPIRADLLSGSIRDQFGAPARAVTRVPGLPTKIEDLMLERYTRTDWHHRH